MSIAMSANSSFLLRNVSFTMRLRFTPARACATYTRTLDTRRLAFFFRLASYLDRRLIPLESRILIQDGFSGINDVFLISNLLVVCLAGVGGTEKQDSFAHGIHHQDVLVGVGLLLATVEKSLFFRVFRPLAAAFGAVDDQLVEFGGLASHRRQAVAVSFRHHSQVIHGGLKHGQQTLKPIIGLRSTHAEQLTQNNLQGIGFQVDQEEQEFILDARQNSSPACLYQTFAGLAGDGMGRGINGCVGFLESSQ